jgi:hypothetical protein
VPQAAADTVTITITITSSPAGALVTGPSGEKLGRTPLEHVTSRSEVPLVFTLTRSGRSPESVEVVPDEDRNVEVPLKRRRPRQLPDDPKGWR